jgi:hypothetical protein
MKSLAAACALLALTSGRVAFAAPVPSSVASRMPAGSVSVRYGTLQAGPDTLGVHIFRQPRQRKPSDLGSGPLPFQPFFVDVFTVEGGKPVFRYRARYEDEAEPESVTLRWLRPAEKRGPILLVSGGFTHWRRWVLVGLPDGPRTPRSAFTQEFLCGGEGETYVTQTFDRADGRGHLLVSEEWGAEGRPPRKRVYRWDGRRFSNLDEPFLVIAASAKTREAVAETFGRVLDKTKSDEPRVEATAGYPKLAPGLFVLILDRFRTAAAAEAFARRERAAGIDCYVKRGL